MIETNTKMEEDHNLVPLLAKLDDLTKKILEVEILCTKNYRYIPPHERRKSKYNYNRCVDDTLLIIHQKVNEQDEVVEQMKESIEVLN